MNRHNFIIVSFFICLSLLGNSEVSGIKILAAEIDSVTVAWTEPEQNEDISAYLLRIEDDDKVLQEVNVTQLNYTFAGLETCSSYNVTIFAVNREGLQSNATTKLVHTRAAAPPVVTGLTAINVSSTQLNMSWNPVSVEKCKILYRVEIFSIDNGLIEASKMCETNNCSVSNLDKYTEYEVKVVAYSTYKDLSSGNYSDPVRIRTSPDKAGKVFFFICHKIGNNRINCSWSKPFDPNGNITAYWVTFHYEFHGQIYNGSQYIKFQPIRQNVIIQAEKPTRDIYVSVAAINEVGFGENETDSVLNELQIPQKSEWISNTIKQIKDAKVGDPDTQIALELPKELDESLGLIRLATLIVKEDRGFVYMPRVGFVQFENKPEYSTYEQTSIGYDKPYEIILSHSKSLSDNTKTPQETFVYILGQASKANCSANYFCNGPLKHDTKYYVGLRAYAPDGWRTYAQIYVKTPGQDNTLAIILGCVFGVVFLFLISVGIVLYIARKQLSCCRKEATTQLYPFTYSNNEKTIQ